MSESQEVEQGYDARLIAAYRIIQVAFASAGIELRSPAGSHLAYWINGSKHEEDRYQDSRSRELVEAVALKACALQAALYEAWEYSGFAKQGALPNDDREKINACETLFSEDPSAECIRSVTWIKMAAQMSLGRGRRVVGPVVQLT